MNLRLLLLWHREQQERFENLAENNKAFLPQPYKASLKRTYEKKAAFHASAARLLKAVIDLERK